LLDEAVDAIVVTEEPKRRYLLLTGTVTVLYKAILPDPMANDLGPRCVLLRVIAKKIRNLTPETDISEVMGKVEDLLDRSIDSRGYVIRDPSVPYGKEHFVDLSKIDFEALKAKFERGRKYTQAERLKGAINSKLKRLVRLNRTRIDYLERFQKMIDEYNSGSMNIEEFFKQLVSFAQELNDEEKRGIAKELSEEELAIFDLLIKPEMVLSNQEELQVKKSGCELLETLKRGKLVLDWRKRQQSRAEVRVTIEDILNRGLPEVYKQELYDRKCDTIYQHIYDSYYGAGKSVYVEAA